MTAIDDLKVGDWIAVTGIIEEVNKPEPSVWTNMWVCTTEAPKQHQDGYPLKILAISLPFICVQKNNQTATVDVRVTQVQRLNWRYVKAVLSQPSPLKPKAKKKKEKPNPLACPRCKASMVETLREGESVWLKVCKVCGLESGPICKEA